MLLKCNLMVITVICVKANYLLLKNGCITHYTSLLKKNIMITMYYQTHYHYPRSECL